MARSYCTEEAVKDYLPDNIIPEGSNPTPDPFNTKPENLTTDDLDDFIQQACDRIDGALATIYETPLKKANHGGVVDYPKPIGTIAAILAAALIFERKLQGQDRQNSDEIKERLSWAEDELKLIQNGERLLKNQRYTRGSRFVKSTLFNTPFNPAKDRESKGRK